MEVLRISGGHRFRLKHGPSGDIIALKAPHLIAFSCRGLNFLKPKVLVSEGEQVSLGQPLVAHKHDLRVKLCSPASGRVHEVRFGPRRSLEAIVVAVDAEAEKNVVAQKKYSLNEITGLEKSTVENILLLAGLWPFLECTSGKNIAPFAGENHSISAVHINLVRTEAHWPDPKIAIAGNSAELSAGIAALKRLAPKTRLYCAQDMNLDKSLTQMADIIKVAPKYPADNLGVQAFYAGDKNKIVVGADTELVLDIGHLLLHGIPRTTRLYALAGNAVHRPSHYRSRIGIAVGDLVKEALKSTEDVRVIAGGLFKGQKVRFQDFLGPKEYSVQALIEDKTRIPLVFFRLGLDRFSLSKAWASGFKKEMVHEATTNNNGEERACIQCGYCIDICPVKLMPNLILKASLTKDIEKMQWLSINDCVDCGLCTFVCPSKIELGQEIISGKELIAKEG
jgi:Na+-transporting NADH:ubiquinone oxidoreductase subunit A